MENIYDEIYDGFLADMYDDFYEGILDIDVDSAEYVEWLELKSDEYEMWLDAKSDIYEDWLDAKSDVYEYWSDISADFWDEDREKAVKTIEGFSEEVAKLKGEIGTSNTENTKQEVVEETEVAQKEESKTEQTTANQNTNSSTTSQSDTANAEDSSTDLVNGMRPEFKEAMDSYEAFYDEYCAFKKNTMPIQLTHLYLKNTAI